MRTSLTVTATLLTGLALTAAAVMRKVHRLEKELEDRWAAFAAGPTQDAGPLKLPVNLAGAPIQIDYIAKEVRTHYIHQT